MNESVARILDANFNRAREALRVIEDYARFVQDDPVGCERVKHLRHDLAGCIRRLAGSVHAAWGDASAERLADALLAARDTPGDVGTHIVTESEQHRADARDVCVAALKRLPEALRTLEEYGKTLDAAVAAEIEALRYRAYDLEQRMMMRGDRSARFARVQLYVLVTESLCRDDWLSVARAAIAGGADCLQLREKNLDDGELLSRARRLRELCREHDVLFIVNDRPDIARLADADGVHLGQTDMPMVDARRILGPDRLIGVSTHNREQFDAAVASGPDYIAVGPMFQSSTKPQDHVPGPDLAAYATARTGIPIVPIGGIVPENAGILYQAGCRCVCVCSAVISADDVEKAARQFKTSVPR
ncbi:MAG TPA: thiamine phosphate synthase [Phycisphaerae bacterium]|nr:thiamine phosphate synthase [Phycisphaerae bacterium]